MKIIRPRKLKKGDAIGFVTPASAVADSTRIDKAARYFESLGYHVEIGRNVGKVHGYLAGTDEERVSDLHAMFADKRVKAVIALRGGYGTPRLLSHLNYRLIAQNPKIVCGFSDMTGLQLALWKRCGLITFHGPMAAVDFVGEIDQPTEEMFWRAVTSTKKLGKIPFTKDQSVLSTQNGATRGRLIGGNLSLIVTLLGTRYQPDFARSLLFLEEITEEPYRVDRMLAHLDNAGVFTKASGLLLGQFTDCNPADPSKPSLSIDDVLRELQTNVNKPTLSNLPFGHVTRKLTLPIGLMARLDAKRRDLELLEAAVT